METRTMHMPVFASYESKPCLGGNTWDVTYHCPVVGCLRKATVDCPSNRRMWRLCTRCAKRFNNKPGHMRFVPKMTLPRLMQDLVRRNMGAQVDDAVTNILRAVNHDAALTLTTWSHGGKDASPGT